MSRKKEPVEIGKLHRRPAINPDVREQQLISLAVDLVEQRLMNGTASSQEVTHFLKLGSERAKLEMKKLEEEKKLLEAKTEAIQSAQKVEELYLNALSAMKQYSGEDNGDYTT